ncbi:protein DOP1A-like isoform X3 [Babylonia areolata]|uniref:protein DOP1A-like isoform X3 n=1 Tax=Babylonia areolata TaxID=304850 RepID=UPI003FD24F13
MSMLTVEECELLSDSKYRSYISQVEKALKSFEYTSEWADLISALGKLNKVLLNHMKYPVIPKKVTIGKRLAQCLHPALPSGVHLKALEAYDIIFKCIGPQRLAQDLFVYSAGLFPVIAHAAMSVKPVLLTVYEKHFVQLGRQIKPGLNGLLLGLLPGLEEGAEYFDRTNTLLEEFCEAADPPFFYTGLWECVLNCPSVRLPAVTFLLNHFNKRRSMEDQLHMMGLDIDLMVQALCSALQDSSVLVQRSSLDFLLLAFPMHNGQLTRTDLATIVEAAINVVLRRDMSLNRRLYLWFLGTSAHQAQASAASESGTRRPRADSSSTTSEFDLTYFHNHSKDLLVAALKHKLSTAGQDARLGDDGHLAVLRPFRILISLLDKPEIGPVIIEDVLLAVFRSLYQEGTRTDSENHSADPSHSQRGAKTLVRDSKHVDELVKTANLLFGSFESYFIWEFIGRLFSGACDRTREVCRRKTSVMAESDDVIQLTDLCHVVELLLDVISLDVYPESTTEHLPDLLHQVITAATGCIEAASDAELTAILSMCSKLLSRVQPSMATPSGDDMLDSDSLYRGPDSSYLHGQDDSCAFHDSGGGGGGDSKADVSSPGEEASDQKAGDKTKTAVPESSLEEESGGKEKVAPVSSTPEQGEQSQPQAKLSSDDNHEPSAKADQKEPDPSEETGPKQDAESPLSLPSSELKKDLTTTAKVPPHEKPHLSLKTTTTTGGGRDKEFVVSSGHHRQKSREDKPREHLGLMQQCLGSFQEFFHCIVTRRFLESEKVCEKCMELLTLTQAEGGRTTSDQDSLFDESSVCSADSDAIRAKLTESGSHPKVKPRLCTEEGQAAFVRACRLLVDFASFPLYCADYQTVIDQMYHTEDEGTLPQWLQDLLTCSCYVHSFPLQASAIATMLDLIVLTQSVQSETQNKSRDTGRMSISEGRVSVVILPALLPRHLQHINDNTIFYQVIARELWQHLGTENTENHHRTAELFYMLHQVTPRAWICEDAIGTALISDSETTRLNAFKKFSVLWHLTRNMKADSSLGHKERTFDRSMFVVLDSLKEESSAAKSLTITWLTQVVQRGDISRVLRPVLLMLLHPDTARISIQHVNVHDPKRVSLTEAESDYNPEANIYAISSEGGNLIFHVNHNPQTKISRKSTEDLKSMALTVMNQKGSQTSTAPVRAHSEAELSYERVNPEEVKLRFNPFGSVNSLDKLIFDGFDLPGKRIPPDLSTAKRLDKQTCQKEGIFFDGKEEEEPAPELTDQVFANKELTSEEVVAEVMADLWNRVMTQIMSNERQRDGGDRQRKASVTSSQMCDHDLLNAIETASLEVDSSTSSSENDLPRASSLSQDKTKKGILSKKAGGEGRQEEGGGKQEEGEGGVPEGIHPLHMHLLLYTQPYDYHRTLYALSTIRAMLVQCPRLVVTAMATTSISAIPAPHLARIQTLLARHRKSVFGKNFFGELPAEVLSSYRSNMFLEVVISLCLYCMRGYFPNLMMSRLTDDELMGNNLVHSQAAEVLTLLLSELLSIMRDSGRSFVSYISDLLGRCKLQKALLHTLLASVYDARHKPSGTKKTPSLTEAIIEFNNAGLDASIKEAFQTTLLRLVLVAVMLEDQITHSVGTLPAQLPAGATSEWDRVRTSVQYSLTRVRFRATEPIAQQTMFLSGVLSALKQRHLCHLHRHWVGLVTSALPFMGRALTQVVLCVVSQLCRNLEELAAECYSHKARVTNVPPDHMVTLLEGLTTLCHYCLLDSNTHVSIGQPAPAPTSSVTTETASAGHILTNLIHVFNPIGSSRETSPQRDTSPVSPVLEARNNLLSIMPRIMACMATLWKAVSLDPSLTPPTHIARQRQDGVQKLIMGEHRVVRQHILELLSPISLLHGTHLLGAFAVAWNDRRQKPAGLTKKTGVLSAPCEDQLLLVELVGAIKVLPMDTLIQTVKAVLKNPPSTELSKNKKSVPLEVNLLQLFFAYVQQHTGTQLLDSWPALLSLIRDVLAMGLQPPSTFILLHILNDFVQKAPTLEEKKAQKELQDITQKVLESVAMIAGTSLEQTTWLRRNYAVKPGRQSELGEGDEAEADQETTAAHPAPTPPVKVKEVGGGSQATDSKYSVQALMLLAELMAPMLDVVYSSEEKEKVVPFLTTLLQNVFPYLRHHSVDNMPSFRACSQLLSSVSGYQYSRKAWRKEGLELLLDPSFLQMDLRSLASWRVVIDNLLTHDRITFKDLMNRVSMTQSGSLNLFSSKEQEFELRSQMLKRLSFAIFCSPLDQYQRNMPEIQERLAESLRLPQVPSVMTQVFLCFRVLILRMSPQHLTSLWPTMITEMVQVFLQIEQELSTETDEFNQYIRTRSRTQLQRIAALDSSWAHLGNGLNAHNNPSWLNLYLSVCRLLDLCLVMPADAVPQFQLYRWAFIGTAGEENKACSGDDNTPKQKDQPRFTPHIIRLASLLNSRLNRQAPILQVTQGRPLLTIGQLRSIAELQPFFNTLCLQQSDQPALPARPSRASDPPRVEGSGLLQVPSSSAPLPKSRSAPEKLESRQAQELQLKSCQQHVEELLERDFLETVV